MSTAKKIPVRLCVGCGEMKPKKEFIIDKTGRKNGRGAYICSSKECLEKAISNHGLERSFKMKIDKEVYDRLRESL